MSGQHADGVSTPGTASGTGSSGPAPEGPGASEPTASSVVSGAAASSTRSAPELTDRFAELLAAASLSRAILRREARGLAVWALGLGVLAWYSCVALRDTYSTAALRAAAAALERTPGVAAFTGPGLGMEFAASGDSTTAPALSAIVANEVLLYVALGAAVLAILTVIRHTRATEETGQAELVRAGALRRGAEGGVVLLVLDMELTVVGIAVLVGLLLPAIGTRLLGGDPAIRSLRLGQGMLLAAIAQAGGSPERALLVGDSAADVQTARNAGAALDRINGVMIHYNCENRDFDLFDAQLSRIEAETGVLPVISIASSAMRTAGAPRSAA